MATQTHTQSHQSAATLAGTWKLLGGRAMTLQPHESGMLRVARGSLWVTGDGPHTGPLNDQGDRFLQAGEQVRLLRGQRLVIEAWDKQGSSYFSWDPLPQAAVRSVRAELVQPVEDLRRALGLGASAAGRLLAALAALGWASLGRERPSLAECAFNAHSSACRAHGAMS
jgi:hypothetical protein